MSIGDKEKLVADIINVGSEDGAFSRLLDVISGAIVSIAEFPDSTPREILEQIEDLSQMRAIVEAIVGHCSLTDDEAKNSLSSSEQPTPVSAGNADSPA